jgi:hypothetical protein
MKILLITLSLLSSSVAFSAEQPKGLGQFDPQQCACETCFTKYGVCTSVNQGREREDVKRSTASKRGSRGAKTTRE